MTTDDEQLCAALERKLRTGPTNSAMPAAAARIRALSTRLQAAEKMAEALREYIAMEDDFTSELGSSRLERARAALDVWEAE